MFAVSLGTSVVNPAPGLGAGAGLADTGVSGEGGFLQVFVLADVDVTEPSDATPVDCETSPLLKDRAEETVPLGADATAVAPQPLLAQAIAVLPVPLPQMPLLTADPSDLTSPVADGIRGNVAPLANTVVNPSAHTPSREIAVLVSPDTAAKTAQSDGEGIAAEDALAKAPAIRDKKTPMLLPDIPPADPLPDLNPGDKPREQPLPQTSENPFKTASEATPQSQPRLGDVSLVNRSLPAPFNVPDVASTLPSASLVASLVAGAGDLGKPAPTKVSTAENTWRQAWAADATVPARGDQPFADKMFSAAEPVPDTATSAQITPVTSILQAGTTQFELPSIPVETALSHPTAPEKPALPNAVSDKGPGKGGFMSATLDLAANPAAIETLDEVFSGNPDIGTTSGAPKSALTSGVAPSSAAFTTGLPQAVTASIVEMTVSRDQGPVELALTPIELGKVTISIKHDGNYVHVTITAERSDTLDLMRRHANDLVADLRSTGFSGASLSFGQGQKDPRQGFANPEPTDMLQQPHQNQRHEIKSLVPSKPREGAGVDLRF